MAATYSTLVDLLRTRALDSADVRAYTMLFDEASEPATVTYAELDRRARAIGAYLQALGLAGRPAVLLYAAGLEYISAFFGCLYAGVIAIPAHLPRSKRDKPRVQRILADSQARFGLTMPGALPSIRADAYVTSSGEPCQWLTADAADLASADDWRDPGVRDHAVAYLQYTSGSTADPKGVMVSHRNVLRNLSSIDHAFEHTAESLSVCWLPHFHDMGLVYGIIAPLHGRFPAVLMSPMSFIQRPGRWLQAISAYRVTHSGGPNFAYDLCVRGVPPEQRQDLDLTSWRIAFNGAEPVRSETLSRFVQAFGPCGFAATSFCPAYGLAEATLKVSCGPPGEAPVVCVFDPESLERNTVVELADAHPRGRTLVGCGRPSPDTRVAIVDPASLKPCPANEVGEIWISGPSVARGYWRRPQESARTFRARTSGAVAGRFVRTGDLGFIHRGELFVAGRLKDLIIIRGHNYYPQDIEQTVASAHAALKPGCGAAFSVDVGDEERLVVVHEIERTCRRPDVQDISRAIRSAVGEHHRLQVYAVTLVKAGSVPRTSSGKVQRHACRQAFLAQSLDAIGTTLLDEPIGDPGPRLTREALGPLEPAERQAHVETYLREHVAAALGLPSEMVGVLEPLIALGCDSLIAAELRDRLEFDLQVSLPAIDIIGGLGIRHMAIRVVDAIGYDARTPSEPSDSAPLPHEAPGAVDAGAPLSFEQERLWFLNEVDPGNPVYNIPAAMQLEGRLEHAALERSVTAIVRRHEPLRASFRTRAAGPVQTIAPPAPVSIPVVDLQRLPADERELVAARLAGADAQRPFDLERERLFRVLLIRLAPGVHRLILVAHHIVFDGASLAVFLRELQVLYEGFALGRQPALRDLTHTYRDFAVRQRAQTGAAALDAHLRFWEERLRPARRPMALPTDRPRTSASLHRAAHVAFELPADLCASIATCSRREHATPFMTLLAAYGAVLAAWTGERHVTVGSPTRGRPPQTADLIGLFAYPLALCLEIPPGATLGEIVRHTRERVLEAYVHEAVPFAKVVEAARPDRRSATLPLVQVMFSLVKDPTSTFSLPGLSVRGADLRVNRCQFDLWLTLLDASGSLHGVLTYNQDLFEGRTATMLADSYVEALRAYVERPDTRPTALSVRRRAAPAAEDTAPAGEGTIAIASSFTAEELQKPIAFWMAHLGYPLSIRFAPIGQLFQQLLDPHGLFRENRGGVNVVALRLEDCCRLEAPADCEQVVDDLVGAMRTAAEPSGVPHLVCLCPASPAVLNRPESAAVLAAMEDRLVAGLRELAGTHVITAAELNALYPVRDYYDRYGDEISRSPYTELFVTALGTLISRKIHALRATPYKVIVLDCDETLWLGRCGEGGGEIHIDGSRRFLQDFMLAQRAAGMLLCLCSRNNESEVFEAFRRHPEMPLRPEHLISWRINWRSKSDNLKSLSDELRLALDSFVFVDDSAFECAEVRANCPAVLTLQLPEAGGIERALRQSWAFDHLTRTEADAARSERYTRDRQRAQARESATSLEAFLSSLELEVTILEAAPDQWARVAQLVRRTNQFNLTGHRRSESEIRNLCGSGRLECLVADVSDRFGDYGLVGAMLFEMSGDALLVDTFVLSCRAMGRGVERAMVRRLAEIAAGRGRARVDLRFVCTSRNEPAREFVEAIAANAKQPCGDYWMYSVPAAGPAAERELLCEAFESGGSNP